MSRHLRQMILPEVGEAGQARLAAARVLVIGAGGLASPSLMYLGGAGIGDITIVDHDHVEVSNLHRQPIHAGNAGMPKADSAAAFLSRLDPGLRVTPQAGRLTARNALELVAKADLVLDCADVFAVSYMLSDACLAAGVPLISASALGLEGYCGGFCAGAPSLRALFPDLPDRAATCATAGVLGPVVGMIGTMQAQMALSVLLGLQPSPLGQLVTLGAGLRLAGFRFDGAPEPEGGWRFIDPADISAGDYVVDLRTEAARPLTPDALWVDELTPLAPPPDARAVLACRSGLRAWRAARRLASGWDGPIALIATGDD